MAGVEWKNGGRARDREREDSVRPSVRQSVFASMEIFHLSDTHACPLRSGAALQLYAYLRVAI